MGCAGLYDQNWQTTAHVVSALFLPQFQLCGESNSIKFDVTPQFFDCGMQPYDRAVDKEFFISNSGKVRIPGRLQASMQKAVDVLRHPAGRAAAH